MTKKRKYQLVEDYMIANREAHYRVAYSYVKSKENALDIIQESIYKALHSIDKLADIEAIKPWFYRILINTALDFIRKHKKISYVENEILDLTAPANEDHYTDIDLQQALDDLPALYKTVIILKYFEGFKLEEIAKILDENVNTIKTRLYTGLKKLRIQMEVEENQ
ncbi:sigma-70 family RNA polymerase sigma factor [Bacillus sp. REN10]|uniref:RNA polymerase sigma factor n=1 Tax=Bacillus sp. REN10 TaxID=2782541 RepID=UPI00193B666E|nr:sigma-70 family RNA polymerase sigma factor [Bacillus sp. REN10]